MRFEKTARIEATLDEIWALLEDIEAVAHCIPGVDDFVQVGPTEFSSVFTQRVGPVTARFKLTTKLAEIEAPYSVTAISEGSDTALDSMVRSRQVFVMKAVEGESATEIAISADVQMVGRIATFGQRIIATKSEQVVLESLANVSTLLEDRRGGAAQ